MVPIQGRNHMLGVTLKQEAQVPQWYVGLFEGDYTPTEDVTAQTLPGLATECTAYAEGTRVPLVLGPVAAGSASNADNVTEFTFSSDRTVRGAFIVSAPTKGAATGVLFSIARFPSPRVMAAGSVLRVLAGPTGVSIS